LENPLPTVTNPVAVSLTVPTLFSDGTPIPAGFITQLQYGFGTTAGAYTVIVNDNIVATKKAFVPALTLEVGTWYGAARLVTPDGPGEWGNESSFQVIARIPKVITDMQITAVRTLTTALAAPALSSSVSGSTATLNWTAPSPTGQSVIAGYRVYKSSSLSGTYTQVGGALPANQLSLTDTLSATSFYKVEAFDQFTTGSRSTGVQCNPISAGAIRIHPGHGFHMDNQFFPGNQVSTLQAAIATIANPANACNRVNINFTWSAISDAALTNGKQTFTTFRNNLTTVLNILRGQTQKKVYLSCKLWQGAFYSTHSGSTTSVSGSTITDSAGFGSTGWTYCNIGNRTYPVTSSTTTTATLSGYSGGGGSYLLGKQKQVDGSYWPAWMPASWINTFFQTNTNARAQLDSDNPAMWAAKQEMYIGVAQAISDLDTDNRIDLFATADESIDANVDINGGSIQSDSNYQAQLIACHQAIQPYFAPRMVWCPASYLATNEVPGLTALYQQLQAFSSNGFGYGGPDTPLFGVHGTATNWYTTFLQLITGNVGTLGDIRDNVFKIGNSEGPGLGTGSSYANCPPPLSTAQATYVDACTRNAVPAVGSRPAHTGMGCQIMIWPWQSRFCLKSSDLITVINANNGAVGALPAGNWDTSP